MALRCCTLAVLAFFQCGCTIIHIESEGRATVTHHLGFARVELPPGANSVARRQMWGFTLDGSSATLGAVEDLRIALPAQGDSAFVWIPEDHPISASQCSALTRVFKSQPLYLIGEGKRP